MDIQVLVSDNHKKMLYFIEMFQNYGNPPTPLLLGHHFCNENVGDKRGGLS